MQLSSFVRGVILSFGLLACGGGDGGNGGTCAELCTEAQAGACTSITGNCTAFCDALDGVQGAANCTSQRNAYQACLDVGSDVCANGCDGEETTMTNCLEAYCAAHTSDADCQTLANSF